MHEALAFDDALHGLEPLAWLELKVTFRYTGDDTADGACVHDMCDDSSATDDDFLDHNNIWIDGGADSVASRHNHRILAAVLSLPFDGIDLELK